VDWSVGGGGLLVVHGAQVAANTTWRMPRMTKRRTKAGLNTLGQIVAGTQLSLNHLSVLPLAARSAVVDILLIGDGVALALVAHQPDRLTNLGSHTALEASFPE